MGLKSIYTAIEAQIKAINGVDGLPLYKHMHTWNNQFMDLLGERNNDVSIPFPAAFIQIDVDDIKQLGNNAQELDCTLKIHIAHQFMNANYGEFEQNWEVFDVADLTYKAMQMFQFDGSNELVRVSQTQDFDHGNLYHFIQSYRFNYIDILADYSNSEIDSVPPTELNLTITQ